MKKQHNQEEEREEQDVNTLVLGDLQISSTTESMSDNIKTATKLLNNPSINKYLSVTLPHKRLLGV